MLNFTVEYNPGGGILHQQCRLAKTRVQALQSSSQEEMRAVLVLLNDRNDDA